MIKAMNVASWVERWAALRPRKAAIIYEGESISYSELKRRADRAACWLQDVGVEKGDRVAVFLNNCPEFMELYLASAHLGAIFVPINFRLVAEELSFILSHCKPRVFVYAARFGRSIRSIDPPMHRHPVVFAKVGPEEGLDAALDYQEETRSFEGRAPFVPSCLAPADPEEPHVIMYTSGTTGRPKGAVLSHRKTFFNSLNADIFLDLSCEDVLLLIMPLFHSGGLFIMASPAIYKGATIVLHPRFDPIKTYRHIDSYQVTKLLAVPTMYRQLMTTAPPHRGDLSTLQVCAIGGEMVTPELIAECAEHGFRLRQIFGQTETSILLWASEEDLRDRPGTVGRPVFHAEVKLADASGDQVAPGAVGQILARGPIVMKEYWAEPEETEATIRGGWLRTGDMARQDEDGYYYLVDRWKDMYISGGENVYPAEIERVLKEHPGVEDAAVIGMPDPKWGEVGHAFIIRNPGALATDRELLDFCRDRLAGYKCPNKISFCTSFPRTPLGKVRKFVLRGESEPEQSTS